MRLQSDNLDDDLIAQGLTSVNSVKKVYDFNVAFGGPVLADRLWFFAAARRWGTTTGVANLFADTSVSDFIYTPDSGRPIEPEESNKGIGARLTLPGHLEGQAHVLVGQAAEFPGSAHRAARDRHHQERRQSGLLPATRGDPGGVEPAAVEQRALRRRRDGEQVQLRRLRRGPVPVGLRRLRRQASRTTCRSTTPASGSPTTASATAR